MKKSRKFLVFLLCIIIFLQTGHGAWAAEADNTVISDEAQEEADGQEIDLIGQDEEGKEDPDELEEEGKEPKKEAEEGEGEEEISDGEEDPELLEYIREAQGELESLAGEEPLMALVYLSNGYEVKDTPDPEGETVTAVPSGTMVLIRGMEVDNDFNLWFRVSFEKGGSSFAGYVQRENLAYSNERFIEWENAWFPQMAMFASFGGCPDVEAFPASYQDKLLRLKQAHPNWTFVRQDTNLDWQKVVKEECYQDRSLISSTFGESYRGDKYGTGWYYASEQAVKYYLDPRNFLDDTRIFQFEQLTYNPSYHSKEAIQNILRNTFMKGEIPGEGTTYAEAFFQIGVSLKVSPFHLACRVYQEQGQGKSDLISGNYTAVPQYKGYYNYYNISAHGKTTKEIVESGLAKAVAEKWNTRYASLKGGAGIIAKNYILRGQDTLYLQKFDVDASDGTLFYHQYMQNITAPYTESQMVKKAYVETASLDNPFVFKIPVYKDMPSSACPVPGKDTTVPTASPTATPTAKPTATPIAKPTAMPTVSPTAKPTATPTAKPTAMPTATPTTKPTATPTAKPTEKPAERPTVTPTTRPTAKPTVMPTAMPTAKATTSPTASASPKTTPAVNATEKPVDKPTTTPTEKPTAKPTVMPTAKPVERPTATPTAIPTVMPTATSTEKPTAKPAATTSVTGTVSPSAKVSTRPEETPGENPAATPSSTPTSAPVTSPAAAATKTPKPSAKKPSKTKPTAIPGVNLEPIPEQSETENAPDQEAPGTPATAPAPAQTAEKAGTPESVTENTTSQGVTVAAATPKPHTVSEDKNIVTMDMRKMGMLYEQTLRQICEQEMEVILEVSDKASWTIDGSAIDMEEFTDVDLNVTLGKSHIPAEKLEILVQGEQYIEMSLAHDGEFGFTAQLALDLGNEQAGKYANLFYYNEEGESFEFVCTSEISSAGVATFEFRHASDYVIIMSDGTKENLLSEKAEEFEEVRVREAEAMAQAREELPAKEPGKAAGFIALILLASAALGIGVYLIVKRRDDD